MTTSSYLFQSATVISGDGSLPSEADVLISSGKIVAIGPHIDVHPELNDDTVVIDTLGLVLCPGFIDMHAHSDLYLLTHPGHEPKVSQGVTTEVVGQDGELRRGQRRVVSPVSSDLSVSQEYPTTLFPLRSR
jgi:N-acyl-D-amino-acid deacylase